MIALQRQIAHDNKCVYFDSLQFMGGPGSIVHWACSEDPRLANYDLVHLSSAGYEALANGLIDAVEQALVNQVDPADP